MRLRYLSFLLTIFLAAGHTRAQSAGAVTYTAADGLATGNFQSFFQDRQGYLWVGSYASGFSRFDGKTWQTWDMRNGLLQNLAVEMYEDKEGGIWFGHGEHGVSRFYRGKFKKHAAPKDLSTSFNQLHQTFLRYDRLSGHLWRYDYATGAFSDHGEKLLPDDWMPRYEQVGIQWQIHPGRYLLVARRKGSRTGDLFFTTPGRDPKPEYFFTLPKEHTDAALVMSNDSSIILMDYAHQQFLLLQNNKIRPFPAPGWSARPLSPPLVNGTVWHADPLTNTLLLVWPLPGKSGGQPRYLLAEYDLNGLQLRQTLLFTTSYKVAHCFKDRAGTYWVSTDANVMRLFPEHFFIPTDAPGMMPATWTAAQAADGQIWFSSYGFGLAGFDGLDMHPAKPPLDREAEFDNGSLVDAQGKMFFNVERMRPGGNATRGLLKFDGVRHELLLPGTTGFFLAYDRQGRLMRGMQHRRLWILPKNKDGRDSADWIKIDRSKGLGLENVLTALEDRYGRYWMGRASQGLACYTPDRDTVFNWIKSLEKPHYGVMSMDMDPHGNLWLGTDRGLCFLQTPAPLDGSFDPLQALRRVGGDYTGESMVTTLKLYDAHTLLFGNALGFYLLDLDTFYAGSQRGLIRTFNLRNGSSLGAVEQNAIFVTRERQIWLLGVQGALRFDPRLVRYDTVPPVIWIDSVGTNTRTFTDFSGLLGLGSGEQRVRLYFHHDFNPLLLDNVRFRYRLTGDSAWSALREAPFVEFARLAPGRYTFQVKAEKDGFCSVPAGLEFRIAPLWWQNPWSWLAALAGIIGFGLFLRNKEQKISRQQIQLEKSKTAIALMSKEKDRLQVQAIVNQLNPHFINNTLQWLQVRVDEDEEAVRVVGKLSENIAAVFKNSRQKKPFHALSEEIKLAENYLYIQKCRFRERLHYALPNEATLKSVSDINVPLMIIQIHVENAVEHGIRSKTDGTGRVDLAVRTAEEYVIITVTDDGVGRAAAGKIGSRGTQNGTLMLRELATIYNRQNRLPIEQEYEDGIFVTPDGLPYGTRVIIRIPKAYHYAI